MAAACLWSKAADYPSFNPGVKEDFPALASGILKGSNRCWGDNGELLICQSFARPG